MQQPPLVQHEELHLPPLAWLAVFEHLPQPTKYSLLRCSRALREEILVMGPDFLRFTPGATTSGQLSRQLCSVLQKRIRPLTLTLDMSKGPADVEAAKALLADAAETTRPMSEANGRRTCCVQELIMKGTESAHGWGGLLGAAFRDITTLQLPWQFQMDMPLLAGLAACTRLTKLSLAGGVVPPEVSSHVHLLPGWLPRVHTLSCDLCNGGLALVQGLAGQLRHLELAGWCATQGLAATVAGCTQLVSISLWELTQPVLDALTLLPHLNDVTLQKLEGLHSRDAAHWSVATLSLHRLHVDQLPCLPLAGVRKLTLCHNMFFTLQPSPAASAALMREACITLAAVPQLEVLGLELNILHKAGPVPPAEVHTHMVGVLGALQPLAGKLGRSFTLNLGYVNCRELGPEVLHSLHAAYGDGLTQLTIEPCLTGYKWQPNEAFWQVLPDVLPQLRSLTLVKVPPLKQASVVAAITQACSNLQRAGRSFGLVFRAPCDPHTGLSSVVGQLQVLRPLVCVRIVD